jgi:RNA polymerase sigma factor (sigma-70 family)
MAAELLAGPTQNLLDLMQAGVGNARNELLHHACGRLRVLTSRMLNGFPKLRRWEQTDDVLQNAMLRLCRALDTVQPESPRHFYHLAAQHIRWELRDLAKHHFGPEGAAAKHHTDGDKAADDEGGALHRWQAKTEPTSLDEWTAFHEQAARLPDEEREVFDLLWYDGLTQEQAAEVLSVNIRTIKRRWLSARLLLHEALSDG